MNDGHIRVGDAERAKAGEALRRAGTEGRLTDVELADRLDRAAASRTRGDLAALLTDVLGALAVEELVSGVRHGAGLGPGYSWDDPLVLLARWDNEVRRGQWEVPPFIEANPVLCDVKLDFTEAVPSALLIDVSLLGGAGNLVLIVPGSWGVDTHLVTKGMGSIKNRVVERAQPGSPQIVVRGKTKLGDLKARYPGRFDVWANRRAMARQPRRPELGT